MKNRGFTLIELIVVVAIVVAIVAILAVIGIAAISRHTSSDTEAEAKVVRKQEKPNASLMNRACTSLVKKGEWKCTTKNKQNVYFVHCEAAAIEGEKVTCRCFARVSLENICDPEIYFSLAEFNKKIAELKEDDKSDEEDW